MREDGDKRWRRLKRGMAKEEMVEENGERMMKEGWMRNGEGILKIVDENGRMVEE